MKKILLKTSCTGSGLWLPWYSSQIYFKMKSIWCKQLGKWYINNDVATPDENIKIVLRDKNILILKNVTINSKIMMVYK